MTRVHAIRSPLRRSRSRLALPLALLFAIGGLACDRRVEPFDAAEEPAQPDLARIFPAKEPAGPAAAAMPAAASPAAPGSTAAAARPIRGRVRLAEGVQAAPGATLFVIARSSGASAGPPLAVRRIPNPGFPLDFEIGPEQVMLPNMRFEGEIVLSARLDGDGNAMTREANNLEARAAAPQRPGAEGVELILGAAP